MANGATAAFGLTGWIVFAWGEAAFQGGAYEYLPKPFDVDQAVDSRSE